MMSPHAKYSDASAVRGNTAGIRKMMTPKTPVRRVVRAWTRPIMASSTTVKRRPLAAERVTLQATPAKASRSAATSGVPLNEKAANERPAAASRVSVRSSMWRSIRGRLATATAAVGRVYRSVASHEGHAARCAEQVGASRDGGRLDRRKRGLCNLPAQPH